MMGPLLVWVFVLIPQSVCIHQLSLAPNLHVFYLARPRLNSIPIVICSLWLGMSQP